MNDSDINTAARHLHALQSTGTRGERLSAALQPHTPLDAWRIQRRVSALRATPVRGWKCGLPPGDRWVVAALHEAWPSTARVHAPAGPNGAARIEPEFGFEFVQSLPPRDAPYADEEVHAAIGAVRLAVEVLGCRFADPVAASGPELMADSLWHHSLVLGPRIEGELPTEPAFSLSLSLPGTPTRKIAARHVDGNPRLPLYWLVEFLRQQGVGISAGDVVITGSLAGVIELPFGCTAQLRYGDFGSLALTLDRPERP